MGMCLMLLSSWLVVARQLGSLETKDGIVGRALGFSEANSIERIELVFEVS